MPRCSVCRGKLEGIVLTEFCSIKCAVESAIECQRQAVIEPEPCFSGCFVCGAMRSRAGKGDES